MWPFYMTTLVTLALIMDVTVSQLWKYLSYMHVIYRVHFCKTKIIPFWLTQTLNLCGLIKIKIVTSVCHLRTDEQANEYYKIGKIY